MLKKVILFKPVTHDRPASDRNRRLLLMKWLFLCLVTVLASGCGATMRSEIKASNDNLSGTYRYNGLGEHSADHFPNPLIDLSEIVEPSDVIILQHEGYLQATYLSSVDESVTTGVNLDELENGNVVWRDNMLTTTTRVPITGAAILPLPARHYRGTRILVGDGGELYIVGFFREKGLFFTDLWEDELLLKRRD